MMKPQTILFFGLVGCGKGTQARLLTEHFKTLNPDMDSIELSTGNEYRKFIANPGYVSGLIKSVLDAGKLQPDFMTIWISTSALIAQLDRPDKHVIFDGFPRSIMQAKALEQFVDFFGRQDVKVIYITLSKEEGIKRMKLRNRHDDTDEGIQNRFAEYENNVIPAMDYFKDKAGYEMIEVNGEQTVEKVQADILKSLGL